MFWNAETTEALRVMLTLGSTYDEIAAKLGTTRGSVASKTSRLKEEAPVEVELISIELPPRNWTPSFDGLGMV